MPQDSIVANGTSAQDAARENDLLHYFSQPDELLLASTGRCTRAVAGRCCEKPRRLAAALRAIHPATSVTELAVQLQIQVDTEDWEVAAGRLIYFAESHLRDRRIVLNRVAIVSVAHRLRDCARLARWRYSDTIRNVVIAHEVYHVVAGRPSNPVSECEAHTFARELLSMPFSPLLYEAALHRDAESYRRFSGRQVES